MGSTLSTARRVQFRRALYLYRSDDKLMEKRGTRKVKT